MHARSHARALALVHPPIYARLYACMPARALLTAGARAAGLPSVATNGGPPPALCVLPTIDSCEHTGGPKAAGSVGGRAEDKSYCAIINAANKANVRWGAAGGRPLQDK